jgi:ADP-ribose pyrophosphatase YjhB (NUDIX family)
MVDGLVRFVYRSAYRAARVWWFLRRPRTASALVAVWHGDRLLFVRSSYRAHWSLPGGFLRADEAPEQGAVRELGEELALQVDPGELKAAWRGSRRFEHREDTITVFETPVDVAPVVQVDRREIVWAGWATADEARTHVLLPHLREYLDACVPPWRRSTPGGPLRG